MSSRSLWVEFVWAHMNFVNLNIRPLLRFVKLSTIISLNKLSTRFPLFSGTIKIHRFFFSWYSIVYRLFLLFFLFVFILFWQGNFWSLLSPSQIFSCTTSSLVFMFSIVLFISFIVIFISRISAWFFVSSASVLNFLLCLCIFFLDFVKLSFWVFLAHWVPLTKLSWILFQANHRSPFLRSVTGKLSYSFGMSHFLDISCSLKSYIALFVCGEVVTSSSFYWLTAGEIYLPSTHQPSIIHGDAEIFSKFIICSSIIFLSCVEFLKLYAFSQPTEQGQVLTASHLLFLEQ